MEISQKIVDYAIWYYLKYFPSKKALEKKLFEKFWSNSEKWKIYWWIWGKEIDFILNQKMSSIIFEEEVAKSKIRNYIEKNNLCQISLYWYLLLFLAHKTIFF